MTRYLLDTNIVSHVTRPSPSESLLLWLADQLDQDLFIASLTIAEIWRAVLDKPLGRKRTQLEAWFAGPEGPLSLFAGRVLPFDHHAAMQWARLMSDGSAKGKPRSAIGTMIAAIATAAGCVVVTDNEKDFAGVEIFNPLRRSP